MKSSCLLAVLVIQAAISLSSQGDEPELDPPSKEEMEKQIRQDLPEMKKRKEKIMKDKEEMRKDWTFKSIQAETLWKQALKQYEGKEDVLAEIKIHLGRLDEEAIQTRELQRKKLDPDGAKVRQNSKNIMELADKYNLDANKHKKDKKKLLRDPKLVNFWNKISNMGIEGEDLNLLREELQHYQAKIDEFDMLIAKDEALTVMKRIPIEDLIMSQNLVKDFPELAKFGDSKKMERTRSRYLGLKDILITGIDRLELITDEEKKEEGWEQPLVARIWEEAKNSSFTEEEQESLRVELRHLQEKINQKLRKEIELDQLKSSKRTGREEIKDQVVEHKTIAKEVNGMTKDIKKKIRSRTEL